MRPVSGDGLLPPEAYARDDKSSDAQFYLHPRKVVHIDDAAIAALKRLYAAVLPADGRLLDLRRARPPPTGPGSPVIGSGPTRCACQLPSRAGR